MYVTDDDLEFMDYAELLDLRDAIDRRLAAIEQLNADYNRDREAEKK